MFTADIYAKARLSRDARFDGVFFVAVKTTKAYCRPVCPATPPLEKNVTYFTSSIQAAKAGYRPCLRCRPDSAPHSPAWKGVDTTFERALKFIHDGYLEQASIAQLSDRLGISDRYLRLLFKQHLGVSPKAYALYQQCLFAKKLLHQTQLPITDIALASGFNSIRRFNDCIRRELQLNPSTIRKRKNETHPRIRLRLYYRPPYNWEYLQTFLAQRMIDKLEWCNDTSYGRTFMLNGEQGYFTAYHLSTQHAFDIDISISNVQQLKPTINTIRRILDLDVNILAVEESLQTFFVSENNIIRGLRLPGIWSLFEAGIRAILGQQVSVKAAHKLVTQLVHTLGKTENDYLFFPTPQAIMKSDLNFLNMPEKRKNTLHALANYAIKQSNLFYEPENWLSIKGVGPWTVNYAKMRGLSQPDIYLGGDLGVQKAIHKLNNRISTDTAAPWRSYLTLQLWHQ